MPALKFIAAIGGVLACAMPALAQDVAADLALLESRAAADPELGRVMEALRGNRSTQPVEQKLEMTVERAFLRDGALPMHYRLAGQMRIASNRAQMVAEILRSDLDGDWQITRDELKATLTQHGRGNGGSAAAFVLGDADGNGVLDTAEIKQAVEAIQRDQDHLRGQEAMPRLFDLDDDGILTRAEYDRAVAALKS